MSDYMQIAVKFGVDDKIQKLGTELLQIPHVVEVDFDLHGFYDDIHQVIFLLKYDIPVGSEDYFDERKRLVDSALQTAQQNGLSRTGDRIEDYGEHFYFVTRCDRSWELGEEEDCSPEM